MSAPRGYGIRAPGKRIYDRQLLLLGSKRNEVLDLREVRRYGVDSFGNADYTSIFGLRPEEWYRKGIRLLGRTVVECTRDEVADAIGVDIARIAKAGSAFSHVTVLDPFVGSGNTLYWILHHMPRATGLGSRLTAWCSHTRSRTYRS